jgi:hypothetical protein
MSIELRPSGDATEVEARAEYQLALGPLGPVMDRLMVQRQFGKMLERSLGGLQPYVEDTARGTRSRGEGALG